MKSNQLSPPLAGERVRVRPPAGFLFGFLAITTWWGIFAPHGVQGQPFLASEVRQAPNQEEFSARIVSFYGYEDCLELSNASTRVVLGPASGGRVLFYGPRDTNLLYLPPGDEGWVLDRQGRNSEGKRGRMTAGRFDVGPEQVIPPHPKLWMGRWEAEITPRRTVKLTSLVDDSTGLQLIREFELAARSSRLVCRQTMVNRSDTTKEYCYWSRTFALGQGICIIPLTSPSRFPNGYVMYESRDVMNFRPQDPNIRIRDGFLEILEAPAFPKLGFDTAAGWFAYLMRNNQMLVKQYSVDREQVYNEVAGLTLSIWYPRQPMCELEPMGPRQRLEPGESASFAETWFHLPYGFPASGSELDLRQLEKDVTRILRP